MERKEKIKVRKRIQGIRKIADKVRAAAQLYETFSFLDIEDLMPDISEEQIRSTIQEFRSTGEMQTVRRGVYKYGAGKKKRRACADIIWHLVRSHRQFNTDEIHRLSGAARITVLKYLRCLRKLGHINKTGQSRWMLISDPGPETPKGRKSEVRGQRSEVGSRKSEVRSQREKRARGRKSEVRSQKSEGK